MTATRPESRARSVPESGSEEPAAPARGGRGQAVGAGIIAAAVGFTSSSAVVLAGLTAVGATAAQAASGLLAVCVTQALGMWILGLRYRLPITLAWSTPGAALLTGAGAVTGGWPAAVGAFAVTGVLIVATGCSARLGRLITAIPVEVAQAMLAGVLLPLCLAPLRALTTSSAGVVVPVLAVWLVLQRFASRWAVPGAFGTAVVAAGIAMAGGHHGVRAADLAPRLEWTVPHWSWQAMIGIAIPLYVVTMAAQNLPGVAVMNSFGYRVPWRASMTVTGLGTIAGAPAGGHAINLAAISAALAAAPSAHPDPRRRWWSTMSAGACYLVLAPASAALVALAAAAPAGVLETVAGLALIATFGSALTAALGPATHRTAAAVTFLVSASGIAVFGIGAAFWAVVAGLLVRWVLAAGGPGAVGHTSAATAVAANPDDEDESEPEDAAVYRDDSGARGAMCPSCTVS
ncbi:benzoate membrane transport protein BenE [Nocardia nova SH22a]|uniref:Benzoate membrane transport protein BenE n=1 Tax=Nocardia nova SH22a TaxID=1415166 RepID=W5T9I4_9NOCA|nr:benzoate/H(+) symporter BenE family transporter [Nocardia nova]AHH15995.1 benzoate membrane transport protein BenE [Nocardia nova SH22a]